MKKWMAALVSLTLAAAVLGLAVPAAAREPKPVGDPTGKHYQMKFSRKVTYSDGHAGIFFARTRFAGELHVARADWDSNTYGRPAGDVEIIGQLFTWSLQNITGDRGDNKHARIYAYFNLSDEEYGWFKDGKLAIYAYHPASRSWTRLSTFAVTGTANRVSALTPDFGTFALGKQK
jgi:hypothetical protein